MEGLCMKVRSDHPRSENPRQQPLNGKVVADL
jgi:hypothetical protein